MDGKADGWAGARGRRPVGADHRHPSARRAAPGRRPARPARAPRVERRDRKHGIRALHGRASAAERVEVAVLGELPERLGDVAGRRRDRATAGASGTGRASVRRPRSTEQRAPSRAGTVSTAPGQSRSPVPSSRGCPGHDRVTRAPSRTPPPIAARSTSSTRAGPIEGPRARRKGRPE